MNANFLRRQAEICLALARATFDLSIAARLRAMAREFEVKACELEDGVQFSPVVMRRGGVSGQERAGE